MEIGNDSQALFSALGTYIQLVPIMMSKYSAGTNNYVAKLLSKGKWYASTCVTPGVTARGHSISISIYVNAQNQKKWPPAADDVYLGTTTYIELLSKLKIWNDNLKCSQTQRHTPASPRDSSVVFPLPTPIKLG